MFKVLLALLCWAHSEIWDGHETKVVAEILRVEIVRICIDFDAETKRDCLPLSGEAKYMSISRITQNVYDMPVCHTFFDIIKVKYLPGQSKTATRADLLTACRFIFGKFNHRAKHAFDVNAIGIHARHEGRGLARIFNARNELNGLNFASFTSEQFNREPVRTYVCPDLSLTDASGFDGERARLTQCFKNKRDTHNANYNANNTDPQNRIGPTGHVELGLNISFGMLLLVVGVYALSQTRRARRERDDGAAYLFSAGITCVFVGSGVLTFLVLSNVIQ